MTVPNNRMSQADRILSLNQNLMSFAYGRETLFFGRQDGHIMSWSLGSSTKPAPIITPVCHAGPVSSLVVGDNDMLCSAGFDSVIHCWNIDTLDRVLTINAGTEHIISLCILKNGKLLSGGADMMVHEWDAKSGEHLGYFGPASGWILDITACNNRGRIFASDTSALIVCWDAETRQRLMTFNGHTDWVMAIQISGNNLISGSKDGYSKVWDVDSGEMLERLLVGSPVVALAISQKNVIFSGERGLIGMWDTKSPIFKTICCDTGHSNRLISLSGGQLLASGCDGSVYSYFLQAPINYYRRRSLKLSRSKRDSGIGSSANSRGSSTDEEPDAVLEKRGDLEAEMIALKETLSNERRQHLKTTSELFSLRKIQAELKSQTLLNAKLEKDLKTLTASHSEAAGFICDSLQLQIDETEKTLVSFHRLLGPDSGLFYHFILPISRQQLPSGPDLESESNADAPHLWWEFTEAQSAIHRGISLFSNAANNCGTHTPSQQNFADFKNAVFL